MKGAAIEASDSDKLIPTSAYLRAPQSFAPSPHIPIYSPVTFCNCKTKSALSSGDILANILAFAMTEHLINSDDFNMKLKAAPVTATSIL